MFFIFLLLNHYTLILWIVILSVLASFEFFRNLIRKRSEEKSEKVWREKKFYFSFVEKIVFGLLFLCFLAGFDYFVYSFVEKFIVLFIIISFSDIIAYFVWKNIPWKKWFTKLSPNKSLSGVLAQIAFIFIVLSIYVYYSNLDYKLIIFALLIAILAPVGDLTESYFKRRTGEKDMAYYIPWHGGVLDRIDSIFLSAWIIGWVLFLMV